MHPRNLAFDLFKTVVESDEVKPHLQMTGDEFNIVTAGILGFAYVPETQNGSLTL